MKFINVTGLVMLLAVQLAPHSSTQSAAPMGMVMGRVTHARTLEPLENVRITLEPATVDPEVALVVLSSAARAGISVKAPAGASLSEIITLVTNNAAAQGIPIGPSDIQNMVNEALEGNSVPTLVSDRDGRFEFSDVLPGRYTLRAYREGYFGKAVGGVHHPAVAVDLVMNGRESREAPLSMVQGGSIGGRIYDTSGQLLPDVDVQAFTVVYQDGFAMLRSVVSEATDDLGEYRLSLIPPGDYYIGVTPRIRVATGIQGGKTFYPGVTSVNDAAIVSIRGGEDLNRMDIGIRTAPSFKISGEVTSFVPAPTDRFGLPLPVSAALVLVNREVNTPTEWSGVSRFAGNVALTPVSGRFVVSAEPGSYDLFARISDPGGSPGTAWGSATVEVRDRDVHSPSIVVNRSAGLRGVVSFAGNASLPANVRVVLLPEGGAAKVPQYRSIATRSVTVGQDGDFFIAGVPAGRFRLGSLTGLSPDMYVADVRRDGQSVFDSGFDVGGNVSAPIEIVVSTGSGAVEGAVLESSLKAVAGATVALIPEQKRRENRALYMSTTTDASGRFKVQGVAPGDYKLFAWESITENAFLNTGFQSKFEERGRLIQVGQSGTIIMDLMVIPTFD